MPKFGFLVVEGPHDVEFAYRLLTPFGLKRVANERQLDPLFRLLIPRDYPPGGDLQKRMPTPLFVSSGTHTLAIQSAIGDTRLVQTVEENLAQVSSTNLAGLGIVLDADKDKAVSAGARYDAIRTRMATIDLQLPDAAGTVTAGSPRLGAFVLPNNAASGTLEDLLLDCATTVYPSLLDSATKHADGAATDRTLTADDLQDFHKPAGRNKAVIGAMASVLRPGKAIQVSIQDNRWLRGETLLLPRIKAVQDFLVALFEIESPTAPPLAAPPVNP